MLENTIVALTVAVAGFAYLAGRLREQSRRVAEKDALIETLQLEARAYQNKLLERQGSTPLFDEKGVVLGLVPFADNSPVQILKPPFAAAEEEWEREEQEKRPPSLAPTLYGFVPELSDEQKAEMIAKYE